MEEVFLRGQTEMENGRFEPMREILESKNGIRRSWVVCKVIQCLWLECYRKDENVRESC